MSRRGTHIESDPASTPPLALRSAQHSFRIRGLVAANSGTPLPSHGGRQRRQRSSGAAKLHLPGARVDKRGEGKQARRGHERVGRRPQGTTQPNGPHGPEETRGHARAKEGGGVGGCRQCCTVQLACSC
eukprot:366371-Chlamydomonas_euryale.AAC.2